MNFSVTQNGKPLCKRKYKWDEETKTFSTNESGLVIDFSGIDGVTFNTSYECTFKTGPWCNFNTGWNCTFQTGNNCTFNTNWNCTFKTGDHCIFDTGSECIFNTSDNCTFKAGPCCTFKTGPCCTFNTGENCFTTRYDVKGVIEIPQGKTIKLNGCGTLGYTEVNPTHIIVIDGKEVEISDDSYHSLKESLTTDLIR